MREGPDALVSARADGWLVGGAAIAIWLLIAVQRLLHGSAIPGISGAVYWFFVILTAAHFGMSYHLAYADKDHPTSRHPVAFVVVPIAATAAVLVLWLRPGALGPSGAMRVLISVVFALTIWHYAKQAYGVARVGLALAKVPVSRRQNVVLRYSLYPLWLLSLVEMSSKQNGGSIFGYAVGVRVLPPWMTPLVRGSCLVALVAFVATVVGLSRQADRRLPAAVWAPHIAGFVWIAFAPSYQSAAVVLATSHALQYLACTYRAERTWAAARSQPQPVLWLVCVFGAAAAAGLFVSNWLAPLLAVTVGGPTAAGFAAGLFVVLNLHHYAMDAVMWRSTGSHVKRMVRSAGTTRAGAPEIGGTRVGGPDIGARHGGMPGLPAPALPAR